MCRHIFSPRYMRLKTKAHFSHLRHQCWLWLKLQEMKSLWKASDLQVCFISNDQNSSRGDQCAVLSVLKQCWTVLDVMNACNWHGSVRPMGCLGITAGWFRCLLRTMLRERTLAAMSSLEFAKTLAAYHSGGHHVSSTWELSGWNPSSVNQVL